MIYFETNCERQDMNCEVPVFCESVGYEVDIERCILPEVMNLWEHGITTYCSCCGHSKEEGYIVVGESDRQKIAELGYEIKNDHHKCKHFNNVIAIKAMNVNKERMKHPVTNEKFLVWQREG